LTNHQSIAAPLHKPWQYGRSRIRRCSKGNTSKKPAGFVGRQAESDFIEHHWLVVKARAACYRAVMTNNPVPPEFLKPPFSTEALRDLTDRISQLADEKALERWRRERERAKDTPDDISR
jgi:hypothetical protein